MSVSVMQEHHKVMTTSWRSKSEGEKHTSHTIRQTQYRGRLAGTVGCRLRAICPVGNEVNDGQLAGNGAWMEVGTVDEVDDGRWCVAMAVGQGSGCGWALCSLMCPVTSPLAI